MNSDAKYFKIGIFVLLGFIILLSGIFFLGAKDWFTPKVEFETYFDSSIGGLTVGAPVKFRGVQLGKVTAIDFTDNVYHKEILESGKKYNYILVDFEIERRLLNGLFQHGDLQETLNAAAKKGLRIRVDMAGIAGGNYLEIDQVNPDANPTLEIAWPTRYYYAPSAKSQITEIVNSLNNTLRNLGKVDFQEIQDKATSLMDQLGKDMAQLDLLIARFNHIDIAGTMDNIRVLTENLRDATAQFKSDPSQILWGAPPPKAKSLESNNK